MARLRTGALASVARSPRFSRFDVCHGRRFGAAGVLSLGGAVLALAVLVALTLTGAPAHAAFPGQNGKIVCSGPLNRTQPPPPPLIRDDFEVYTMNPDGSGTTFLTNNGPLLVPDNPQTVIDDFDATVSPDAQRIAFESRRTGEGEIFSMNADGTDQRRLTISEGEDRPGSYSPDGSKIVFHSGRHDQALDLYTMNADGSNQARLTFQVGQDSNPSWSPDGTRIAFHSTRSADQDLEIYTINTAGGDVRRLTNNPGVDAFPMWSPDGSKLAFRRDIPATPPATGTNAEIFTMNSDGSNLTNLTNNAVNDPATPINESFDDQGIWSPDSTRIVFDSQRSGDREVYTTSAASYSIGSVTRLTNAAGFDGRCDWGRARPATVYPPIYPPPGGETAACQGSSVGVIRGTAGNNRITGTLRADQIFAAGGDDVVDALPGNDCVDLGTGADTGEGGSGNDSMAGGQGRDRISGSSGNDRLGGGPGNDRLTPGRGNDRAFGDSGNDLILGSFGNDVLHGVSGNDRLSGSRGRDRINGGSGNDRIAGGSSPDRISGDRGNDRLNGNSASDRINGNSGNDRIGARDRKRDRINCGPGRDTVIADRIDRVARNCERVRRR